MIEIRKAVEKDAPAIHALIHQVGINPLGLNWPRFLVAVDEQDQLVGCGQIKLHKDGSRELASIAVRPEYRGQGIARRIIEELLRDHSGTLYLTCRSALGPFYQKFGFQPILGEEMPAYFWWIDRLVNFFRRLFHHQPQLLVMRRA